MTLFFIQSNDLSLFVRATFGSEAMKLWRQHFGLSDAVVPFRLFSIDVDRVAPGALAWGDANGVCPLREWTPQAA